MSEWKEVTLKDITQLVIDYRGKTPLKLGGDWSDSGYRALSAKNVKTGIIVAEESIRYVNENLYRRWMKDEVQRGDILITSEAPFGEVFFWNSDEKIVLSQRLFDVRIKNDVCAQYVYYYMTSYPFQAELRSRASGTTVLGLKQPELLKTKVVLPDYNTQQRIAAQLSEIDDKIAVNRRICENLEAQAQALFKHLFIDFAPFKNGKFIESELGMIPEGWRVGSLFDIAEVHDSKRKPLSGMQRAKMKKVYPYYGATEQMDMVDDYLFDGRYLLMGEDGSVVRENGLPYIQYVWGKIWVNNHAHVLTGKNGFTTEMLIPFLTKYNIRGLVTGAVQAKLNQANMAKINLAIPPISILENISVLFESLYDTYRNCCTEIVILSTLRDTLLPKLMSGQIKVDEIESRL